jgi:hypothetical protein
MSKVQTTADIKDAFVILNGTTGLPVSNFPVAPAVGGTPTDRSGTTSATPSTATTLMAANAARTAMFIQNNGTTSIWISELTTAVASQPSLQILPNAYWSPEPGLVPVGAISVISTAASVPFTAREA